MESKWIEFIGKNVPSSKNSKMLTGKRIIKSKLCQAYEKWSEPLFEQNKEEWQRQLEEHKERPIFVGFYFFRDSRRKWDFTNIVQLPADLMQKMTIQQISSLCIWERNCQKKRIVASR